VLGVGNDGDNDVPRTAAANQTLVHQYMPPVGETYWVQRTSAPVAQAGTSVTIADTAPTNDRYNLAICEIVGPASTDTSAPVVSITAPAGGAIVGGSVTVSAAASDNQAIAGVQFMIDGSKLGVEVPSSPYAVVWNTVGVADGAHTLAAIARDSSGNTTTSAAVTVTVRNTDTTPPSVSITAPAAGATVSGTAVTFSANASDNTRVASVTFTVDGAAVGAAVTAAPYAVSWNTTGVPNGTHVLGAVARDAAGNQAAASTVSVTVSNASTGSCPCSLWSASTTPARIETTDTQAAELGIRFKADVAGTITGIRFYKGSGNTGTHVGHLWSASGTLLATATFAGETASGWQQVQFSTPVAATANTIYVASYHTNVGQYAVDNAYFAAAGVDRTPLHAPGSVSTAPNGVYVYGASAFPTNSYQASNYWVDVTFMTGGAPTAPPPTGDTTPPTVSITAPSAGATVSGTTAAIAATAADNVGVVGVQFKIDGSNVGPEATASPYSTSWNTTGFVNGTHTLTAVARDAAGNRTTSAAVAVTVSNASPTTTVVFQESTANDTLVTSYLLEVFLAGSNPSTAVPVASVNLGKPTPAANGDISVDETTFFKALGTGTFVVTVSAVGTSGLARSAPVTVTF
jgi:YD repeat-containing protein